MEYNIYLKSDRERIENKIIEKLKEIRQKRMESFHTPKESNPYSRKYLSKYLHEKTRFIKELEEGKIKLDFRTFINLCNRLKISSSTILSEFITEDMKVSSNNGINKLTNPLPNNLPQTKTQKYNEKILGQEIQKYREIKKLSQRKLSENLGFGHGYINNVENGNNDVSMSAFIDICNELECTPNDLLYPFINSKNTNNNDNSSELEHNIVDTPKKDTSNNTFAVTTRKLSPEELEEFNRKYPKRNSPSLSKKDEDAYYSDMEKY